MPVDCELLFSCSPPLFSKYNPCYYPCNFNVCRNVRNDVMTARMPSLFPLRPILTIRQDSTSPTEQEMEQATSPTKTKKRVVFADDKGLLLTQVKIMTEPSNCPPRWNDEFVEQVTKGASATVTPDKWEVTFNQPASDYVKFRQKLDSNCVCLENVIAKETEQSVIGTLKVKNLAFHKEVFVRVTYTGWNAFEDIPATFVPSGTEGTAVVDIYDTFSFSLPIAVDTNVCRAMEFCIGYRCDNKEYWDSNDGHNYRIVLALSVPKDVNGNTSGFLDRFEDLSKTAVDQWAQFASWNRTQNSSPYW